MQGMRQDDSASRYKSLFAVQDNHTLKLASTTSVKRDSTIYKTCWLSEHDETKSLVARYRTWTNRSLKPPYRQQTGWERYSLTGELLDREIRYSKRADMTYLH
jgi:hypothetical protein